LGSTDDRGKIKNGENMVTRELRQNAECTQGSGTMGAKEKKEKKVGQISTW